jgi:hypothetical protein
VLAVLQSQCTACLFNWCNDGAEASYDQLHILMCSPPAMTCKSHAAIVYSLTSCVFIAPGDSSLQEHAIAYTDVMLVSAGGMVPPSLSDPIGTNLSTILQVVQWLHQMRQEPYCQACADMGACVLVAANPAISPEVRVPP